MTDNNIGDGIGKGIEEGIKKGIEKAGKGILKGAFGPVATGVKIGVAGLVLIGGVYAGNKAIQAVKNRGNKDDNNKKNKPKNPKP
jgi:hypothetical protein